MANHRYNFPRTTLENWYEEWATGSKALFKRTKYSASYYERKFKERIENQLVKEKVEVLRKKYSMYTPTEAQIEKFTPGGKQYYWQQQFYLTTNRYEQLRFNQWKSNYIQAMEKTGVDERTIRRFKYLVTFKYKNVVDLLPDIKLLYNTGGASQKEVTEYYTDDIELILDNIYREKYNKE